MGWGSLSRRTTSPPLQPPSRRCRSRVSVAISATISRSMRGTRDAADRLAAGPLIAPAAVLWRGGRGCGGAPPPGCGRPSRATRQARPPLRRRARGGRDNDGRSAARRGFGFGSSSGVSRQRPHPTPPVRVRLRVSDSEDGGTRTRDCYYSLSRSRSREGVEPPRRRVRPSLVASASASAVAAGGSVGWGSAVAGRHRSQSSQTRCQPRSRRRSGPAWPTRRSPRRTHVIAPAARSERRQAAAAGRCERTGRAACRDSGPPPHTTTSVRAGSQGLGRRSPPR